MNPRSRRRSRASLLLAAVTAPVLLIAGCALGGGSDSEDASSGSSTTEVVPAPAAEDSGSGGGDTASVTGDAFAAQDVDAATQTAIEQRSVISTATVSLRTDDVADARFAVQKLVDEMRGEVTDEETSTADDGGDGVRRSRLVVRVPSADFSEAVSALEQIGDLESSTRSSEDVSTQVIDVVARIRAQEQSLARVEVLFGRATSIRDVVAIEAQLTRRQAALDSLKSQQAYLADQTSLSTITVHLERTRAEEEPATDDAGFLPGLADGWKALGTVLTGLATVAGTVLPFAALLVLLGTPAWLLLRRRTARPGRPTRPAAAPSST